MVFVRASTRECREKAEQCAPKVVFLSEYFFSTPVGISELKLL